MIPMAVIMESTENIVSNIIIWMTVYQYFAVFPSSYFWFFFCKSFPSNLSCNSIVDLNIKNSPPNKIKISLMLNKKPNKTIFLSFKEIK